ncbi:MAG: 2-oxoglutarate dehydrogenase complex dihydrolipoyllysine-residue succinyltransferase [Taibaiella sp.]|nr:2-oxoglutarate dehydrogenase complex dihydrolipoyllysine-residue succinyltransferase [Taibaiella sp.]
MIDIKVPAVGESISEVTLIKWLKKDGEYVNRDELLCELESEKATFELNAEQAGILHIKAQEGVTLNIGDLACSIDETAPAPAGLAAAPEKPKEEAPKAKEEKSAAIPAAATDAKATPVAQAIMADKQVKPTEVKGTGSKGRIMKQDVLEAIAHPGRKGGDAAFSREDRKEKMSNLRKTVSRRLVEAKNSTAMLTTFNEVDMTRIMEIRKLYKDTFKESHGVNLGFMSFFTKACCTALQEWPAVNSYVDGDSLIYHDYCDISIAVSAPKGLVVPIIRNAESMSMADIEKRVVELAKKARENKLSPDEMAGGTFTITNGGVFGSLMSTPIINIPQSAILGMHKIQDRPMAINGKVEIRPMMYLALSYDHRVIDGRESVGFLVRVKELLENPEYMLFGADPVKTLLEL